MLGFVQVGILVAIVFGVLGVFRPSGKLLVAGATILFLESVPLVFDGLFVFTLLPGVLFLFVARERVHF